MISTTAFSNEKKYSENQPIKIFFSGNKDPNKQGYHQASTIVAGIDIDALINLPLKEASI